MTKFERRGGGDNPVTQRLCVSFSGGKTSGYMAYHLKRDFADRYEMVFTFANTGQECEETLIFADKCDREFGLNLVWVEAVVHHGEEKASTHKIVTFATASRNGEPFEEVIKKYGIPNKCYLHCTRELKLNPIHSYMASIGWTDYLTAVGIRNDEPARLTPKAGIIYPLGSPHTLFHRSEFGDLVATKPEVNDFWEEQSFDLELPEHEGNCKNCFKKSTAKLVRIAQDHPERFQFTDRMEKIHGLSGYNEDGTPRTFFRGHMSTQDIMRIAGMSIPPPLSDEDSDGGCTESCELVTI